MPTEEREQVLKSATVQIFDGGLRVIGTAFLVSWDLLATRVHVVERALYGRADQPVQLRFFGESGDELREADVAKAYGNNTADIAFLRLRKQVPDGVEPLRLSSSGGLTGQDLRGFGFADAPGLAITASVVGLLDSGTRLQLRSPNISGGSSGAPLWNDRGDVVAMVKSIVPEDKDGRHQDTCFATASEELVRACPALALRSALLKGGCDSKVAAQLNWLEWPVNRTQHFFRVYVIEPETNQPSHHLKIFQAFFQQLGMPSLTEINKDYRPGSSEIVADEFDLVTFPEAFLPAGELTTMLRKLASKPAPMGCVHTGLRPAVDSPTHLFDLKGLRELVKALAALPTVVGSDFEPMRCWLKDQGESGKRFSAGCLFAIDTDQRLRVCLHLKNVRSPYEMSLSPEAHMAEARFLSLVTLRPTDYRMTSIVIQPLICADVLDLTMDGLGVHPLKGLTEGAAGLTSRPPDHVDIVSVATCTPATIVHPARPRWKDKFLDSYRRAVVSDDWRRHRHAVFVLSNFRVFPAVSAGRRGTAAGTTAGLSGAFFPTPLPPEFSEVVLIDVYARPTERSHTEEYWMSAEEYVEKKKGPVLGHLLALDPSKASTQATALGFTINRLPRDANRWDRDGKIVEVRPIPIQVAS